MSPISRPTPVDNGSNHALEMETPPYTLVTNLLDQENTGSYSTTLTSKSADTDEPATYQARETWGKDFEFLLSVIGFAVDLGNVWRFPYICYANGGGAFLVPYFIMYVFGGLPLFYLELALGQFQRVGCITVWSRICPLFKGIGFSICCISFYVSIYYNTIIAWALYYLFASMRKQVPWATCDNAWNTEFCVPMQSYKNLTNISKEVRTTGAQEFFNREVLEVQNSDGFWRMGNIKWSIALCLLAVFITVYFALWKGIKSSGKAVWFTAIFPYGVLIILLVRGVTLDGASQGIIFYLKPEWNKLLKYEVWTAAAAQVFFSLGPGFGVLLALSSYNKFHNNCYRDALITSSINCFTSLLAGLVVFSGLGFMAKKMGDIDISKVATTGPGLVFEVYPEVIAQIPAAPFFAVIFFLMLITLGLDSTFGGLEALITAVLDEWKWLKPKREYFVAVLLSCCFIGSLATTTYGGKYLVMFLDETAAPISIIFIVFLESIAVSWFYGFTRFSRNIKLMLGFEPGIFWKACWAVVSPVFLLLIFVIFMWVEISKTKLVISDYEYPSWAMGVSWLIALSSMMMVPFVAAYKFITAEGDLMKRVRTVLTPEEDPVIPDSSIQLNGNV